MFVAPVRNRLGTALRVVFRSLIKTYRYTK